MTIETEAGASQIQCSMKKLEPHTSFWVVCSCSIYDPRSLPNPY
jgi:hypothetical protein